MPSTSASKTVEKSKTSEKKTFIKVVIRRLPFEMEEDELLEQLSPLPEHESLWFRKADLDLLPFSFARAYAKETDAIAFRNRFNGYVFVDKKGNESMGIVEQAPFHEYPKDKIEKAKELDSKYAGTIEENADYLKFLDEYNSLVSKKVTNFEDLIKEIDEKKRMLKKGNVIATPLTDYLYKLAMEKATRRGGRFSGGRNAKLEKPKAPEKPVKSGKWAERDDRKPFVREPRGRPIALKKEPPTPVRAEIKKDRPPLKFMDKKDSTVKLKPPQEEKKVVEKPIKIMKRDEKEATPKEKEVPKAEQKDKENNPVRAKLAEPIKEKKSTNDKLNEKKHDTDTKKVDTEAKKVDNKKLIDTEAKKVDNAGQPKRNKDRPERQIYQPRARKPANDSKPTQNGPPKENNNVK